MAIANEHIGSAIANKLTDRGLLIATWLLLNDAMPAEVTFMLEALTSDPGYDAATCERALGYVALQFGYPAELLDEIVG